MSKPDQNIYKNYLVDLCLIIKENAIKAKKESELLKQEKNSKEYSLGYLMAYHEIVSLIQQQANAFGIELTEIKMKDINPEKDLL
jgi:hypothetical protein